MTPSKKSFSCEEEDDITDATPGVKGAKSERNDLDLVMFPGVETSPRFEYSVMEFDDTSYSINEGKSALSDSDNNENEFSSKLHFSRTAFIIYASLDFFSLFPSRSNHTEKYNVSMSDNNDDVRALFCSGPWIRNPFTIFVKKMCF